TFAGAGGDGVAIAGAISVNRIDNTADVYLSNAGYVKATDGATFSATDSATIDAFAFGVSLFGDVAVGAEVAYTGIKDNVDAYADASKLTVSAGSAAFEAGETGHILCVSIGAAAAVGFTPVALAGSGGGNVVGNTVQAYIQNGSKVDAADSVLVTAT